MAATHHEVLRSFRDDPVKMRELYDQLPKDFTRGRLRSAPADLLKGAIAWLEKMDIPTAKSPLRELHAIVKAEVAIRNRLLDTKIWARIFEIAQLPAAIDVAEVDDPAGCNYLYRIKTKKGTFVARYHDPRGREFFQRHEPRTAANIYVAATNLFRHCLRGTDSGVVSIVFPKPNPDFITHAIVNEDGGDIARIVLDRIVIQTDQASHCRLLSSGRFSSQDIVERLIGSLAKLHKASGLGSLRGSDEPHRHQGDWFRRWRGLLRFENPDAYYNWLVTRNWIWHRLQALDELEIGEIWSSVLASTECSPSLLRRLFKEMASESRSAMAEYGTLVHLDHAPHNCFVARKGKGSTLLFDFDYVAVADPAYNLGLSINAMVQDVANQQYTSFPDLLLLVSNGLDLYQKEVGPVALRIRHRACAFAGLAMALKLERVIEQGERGTLKSFDQILLLCGRLVAFLLPNPAVDADDDIFGGRFLAETANLVNQEMGTNLLSVSGKTLNAEPREYLPEWRRLVTEVIEDYWIQRDTAEFQLQIPDPRPRTWYGVLPGDGQRNAQVFEVNGYRVNQIVWKDYRKKGVPRICVLLPIENGYRRTFPALASLAYQLDPEVLDPGRQDSRYSIEFHVCVNFSDDNTAYEVTRFAQTLAAVRDISLFFYEIDDPQHLGAAGRQNRWLKTLVLNVMLEQIEVFSNRSHDNVYLHFADDDVQMNPDDRVIASNIKHLIEHKGVDIVSGCYSCDDDRGFAALSSAWKRRRYLGGANRQIINVYGGCMTTTLERLRNVVRRGHQVRLPRGKGAEDEFSEDAYLTIKANLRFFRHGGNPRAYARSEVPVYHPEADNVVDFLRRYSRDRLWGSASVRECNEGLKARVTESMFRKARQDSFEFIRQQVAAGPVRDRLAARWFGALRAHVRNLLNELGSLQEGLSRLRSVDWTTQKTQHQVCKEVVNDPELFARLVADVRSGGLGFALVHQLEEPEAERRTAFPLISRQLALCRREDILDTLRGNRYLYRWYSIAEEQLAVLKKLLDLPFPDRPRAAKRLLVSVERARELDTRYPFDAGGTISRVLDLTSERLTFHRMDMWNEAVGAYIDNRPRSRRDSYTLSLSCTAHSLFTTDSPNTDNLTEADGSGSTRSSIGGARSWLLRYFPITGRGRFQQDSPRRTVYMHLLGEELICALQGLRESKRALTKSGPDALKVKIPRTLYPGLRAAIVNYAGPEHRTPEGRFLEALYIQQSVPGTAHRLWRSKLGDQPYKTLSESLAAFVGSLHGLTLGIRAHLDRNYLRAGQPPRHHGKYAWPIISTLIENLNQIGLFAPSTYQGWLTTGGHRGPETAEALNDARLGRSGISGDVERIIRQEGLSLENIWEVTCKESTLCHRDMGAIGHLGITARNLSVGLASESEWRRGQWGGQEVRLASPGSPLSEIYLLNHFGASMLDPAVEAGFVLDELIAARLSSAVVARSLTEPFGLGVDDKSLTDVWRSFLETYDRVFRASLLQNQLVPKEEKWHAEMAASVYVRLCRVAVVSLLARYHRRREYNLNREERQRLMQTCVDLLHVGAPFNLRFPTEPPRLT